MIVPITRKEKLLNAIATNGNVDFVPKTREELFLFKILGADVNTPTPITRKELLYQHIIDGTLPTFEPQTRLEKFIMAAAGAELELPAVLTREEYWWAEISDSDYETVTGAIVHFVSKRARAIKSLIANISYTQDLNGYDSPWPAGGGKNLHRPYAYSGNVGGAVAMTYSDDGSVTINGTASSKAGTPTILIATQKGYVYTLSAGTYTISITGQTTNIYIEVYDTATSAQLATSSSPTFTLTENKTVLFRCSVRNGITYDNQKVYMQLERGSSATFFTPYSNICPISGWTGANVYHSGADTSDATTYSITFPSEAGTVYGGMVDVTNGKLTVTHGQIASYAGESLPGEWISDRDVYSAGGTPTTGAQVVYELATPQTYQLTPTEIATLLGDNTIWADTGDVTVTY